MRYDVVAQVYSENLVSDGSGGKTTTLTLKGTVHCVSVPADETRHSTKYGVHNKNILQLITFEPIEVKTFVLLIGGFYYRPYYDRTYGKRRVMYAERVSVNGSAV